MFNRRPDGAVRVFSDFVEGSTRARVRACCSRAEGSPRSTCTMPNDSRVYPRVDAHRAPARRERSWTTLRCGARGVARCVPAAQWVGSRLANPYKHKFAAEGSLFEAPITVPWPPAAYNVGQGRCSVLISPFRERGDAPTLGGFVGAGMLASAAGTEGAVTKETALDCVRALRAAGWQPPPQLVAVEVAAEAAIAAAAVAAAANGAAGDARGRGNARRRTPGASPRRRRRSRRWRR